MKTTLNADGKIGIPDEIRQIVNTMLHDAAPYAAIISRLAELGYPGFLKQNISQWRNGGYQDWRRERRHSLDLQRQTEALLHLCKDPQAASNLADANETLMALGLQQALSGFRFTMGAGLSRQDLNSFCKLAHVTNAQMAERTRRQRLALDLRQLQDFLASLNPADALNLKIQLGNLFARK